MTIQSKKIDLIIETEKRVLQFSLSGQNPLFPEVTDLQISNALTPPTLTPKGTTVPLEQREAEMIDRLLDVCAHYCDQGDQHLSLLVDRIGMTLMQIFLERARRNKVENPERVLLEERNVD